MRVSVPIRVVASGYHLTKDHRANKRITKEIMIHRSVRYFSNSIRETKKTTRKERINQIQRRRRRIVSLLFVVVCSGDKQASRTGLVHIPNHAPRIFVLCGRRASLLHFLPYSLFSHNDGSRMNGQDWPPTFWYSMVPYLTETHLVLLRT